MRPCIPPRRRGACSRRAADAPGSSGGLPVRRPSADSRGGPRISLCVRALRSRAIHPERPEGPGPKDGPASGYGAVPVPGSMKEDSMAAELQFRLAGPADAGAVAKLHAESWRHHYRGAYSHAFLDGDVVADRLAVWTDRLRVGSRSKAVLAKPTSPPSMGCAARQPPCRQPAQGSGHRLAPAGVDGQGRHCAAGKDRSVPVGPRAERRRPGLL